MQHVLIVIHLIIVVALVGVVLLQRSEGGGLGMGSGGGGGVGGFMTGRGQANALTRATAILAGLFFLTSIILAVMASSGRVQRSILDGAPATSAPATPGAPAGPSAPNAGGILDQLRQIQNQGGAQPPTPSAPQQ
jgi:preprotein translocase subunit SecG